MCSVHFLIGYIFEHTGEAVLQAGYDIIVGNDSLVSLLVSLTSQYKNVLFMPRQ